MRCSSVLKHQLGMPKALASVLSTTIPKEEEEASSEKEKICVGTDAEVDMSEMKLCLAIHLNLTK